MRSIKTQFFFGFAVMGGLAPYLTVYLASQGLTDPQIGYVMSTGGLAILLSPVLVTLLADARLESRTLLCGMLLTTAVSLIALLLAEGFWPILIAHSLHALAYVSTLPLTDGTYFSMQHRREEAGLSPVPYHHVRVFGTIGFIVPSVALYGFLALGWPIGVTLVASALCAVAAGVAALTLPRLREVDAPPDRLPTAVAARVLLEPNTLLFCIGMWLLQVVASAYYIFYPIYLKRVGGLDDEWLGLIANIGVVIEIPCILSLGLLTRRIGLRGVVALGLAATITRMALLALVPGAATGIATQLFHGLMILAVHVAPPVYLNHRADRRSRNSVQGLYAMVVYGTGRIAGSVLSGLAADLGSVLMVFGLATVLTVVSAACLMIALRHERPAAAPTAAGVGVA